MKTELSLTSRCLMLIFVFTFSVCSVSGIISSALAGDERVRPAPMSQVPDTSRWRIDPGFVFTKMNEPANPYIADLLKRLEAQSGPGKPVSRDEFMQLLRQMEDDKVYISQLIKYATPVSKKIQDDAHESYASRLMRPEKISAGVEFLRTHQRLFEEAHEIYKIEPRDILGILMWESALGKYTGKYRIFNVFMGEILFLDQAEKVALHQIRSACDSVDTVFQNQAYRLNRIRRNAVKNLAVLLRVTKEKQTNPLTQLGSWGGAIGYVQFMPASLRLAVDGDGDGEINLTTWPDAIHSVANYLRKSGYRKNRQGRRRAIFAYNHLDSYVNGVINYADAAWKQFKDEGGFEPTVPDSVVSTLDEDMN